MKVERLMSVIRGPHTSEKTTIIAEKNGQITFKVDKTATKLEIKKAVEHLFDVKVKSVTTVILKGKTKRFAQRLGRRKDIKKAYVSLQEGYDINFATTE
jgi:large subunit ribosomal protein L23